MAMVHEAIYGANDQARINLEHYLQKLCHHLNHALGSDRRLLKLTVRQSEEDILIGMDQSIALGLVICELVSNAFKHAFPDGADGTVLVAISTAPKSEIELVITDNGIGLPANLDFCHGSSLGLRLVNATVTGELNGHIEVVQDHGTKIIIHCNLADS